jgi:hypothetical protein
MPACANGRQAGRFSMMELLSYLVFKSRGIIMSTITIQHLEVDKTTLESANYFF